MKISRPNSLTDAMAINDDDSPPTPLIGFSRRILLGAGMGSAAVMALPGANPAGAASSRSVNDDRLIFLGTMGGPVINTKRAQTATMLEVSGSQYLIDCGYAVGRQMAAAGLDMGQLANIFITHHHSDHVADLPGLLLLTWYGAGRGVTHVWGPPPIKRMVRLIPEMFSVDVESRMQEGMNSPFHESAIAHGFTLPATGTVRVMEDENVEVDAVRVPHGEDIHDAYAYRFDIKRTGRSVVFSGDCRTDRRTNDNLIGLAMGADFLVHEIMSVPGAEALIQQVPAGPDRDEFREHLFSSHTTAKGLVRAAKEAMVKAIVLYHYVPGFVPTGDFVAEVRAEASRQSYRGRVIGTRDLSEVSV
jgi:ribonuclease BN (tRNA processing enzyme)